MNELEPTIGLELHAQLLTKSKMFCSCIASFGEGPNKNICPVCLGLPGALPTVNEKAVEYCIKIGLATHCKIERRSVFSRKNYYYPDCPKNYQITQYEFPLCKGGHISLADNGKVVRIARIHLEEDAGKLLHGENHTLIDMNRCGIPLIEIVTEPDMHSPEEASQFARKLQTILRYLGISDGNMEAGSLRCDVNVSLSKEGSMSVATKTEIKNLNSFKAIEKAIGLEIERQRAILDSGGKVDKVALLWDAKRGGIEIMRAKEEVEDYRYFPEPDLPPLDIEQSLVERIAATLPEMPDERRKRFVRQYGLPRYDASVLTESKEIADFFEELACRVSDHKAASNWVMREVMEELKKRNAGIQEMSLSSEDVAQLLTFIEEGRINMTAAKQLFKAMLEDDKKPADLLGELGLEIIDDLGVLRKMVDRVIRMHPEEKASYKMGKKNILNYFIGIVMSESEGKADPSAVRKLVEEALGEEEKG